MPDTFYSIKQSTVTAIADSIRAKTGNVGQILPENMPLEIEGITTDIPSCIVNVTFTAASDVESHLYMHYTAVENGALVTKSYVSDTVWQNKTITLALNCVKHSLLWVDSDAGFTALPISSGELLHYQAHGNYSSRVLFALGDSDSIDITLDERE